MNTIYDSSLYAHNQYLGIILTSDEQESTLVQGFEMLKSLLPNNAFFGRSATLGSQVIMTDNCDELRNALRETWPKSTLLLCVFHVLQQVWRWLYEKAHGISKNDCVNKNHDKMVYASTVATCDQLCAELLVSDVVMKY